MYLCGLLMMANAFSVNKRNLGEYLNRYRRKRSKVNASIFDLPWVIFVARPRRKKKEENTRVHFWTFSPVGKFRVLTCIAEDFFIISKRWNFFRCLLSTLWELSHDKTVMLFQAFLTLLTNLCKITKKKIRISRTRRWRNSFLDRFNQFYLKTI